MEQPYAISKSVDFRQVLSSRGSTRETESYLDRIVEINLFVSVAKVHRSRGMHEEGVRNRVLIVMGTYVSCERHNSCRRRDTHLTTRLERFTIQRQVMIG